MALVQAPSRRYLMIAAVVGIGTLVMTASASSGQITASPLYNLSTFTGSATFKAWPHLFVDQAYNEIYTISPDNIQIFNESGMEIYHFNGTIGDQSIVDAVVLKDGTFVFLTTRYENGAFGYGLVRADYRGEPVGTLEIQGLPESLSDFHPNRILARDGLLYLANLYTMRVVMIDDNGVYRGAYDIAGMLDLGAEEQISDQGMGDIALDGEGNVLFTLPMVGTAYRFSPDGNLLAIGRRGSGPGKFGIPSSITVDAMGNYLVVDTLRCVVIVFDKEGKYVSEFGGRGYRKGRLIAPREAAMDKNNRLYVSQPGKRGVAVYQLTYN